MTAFRIMLCLVALSTTLLAEEKPKPLPGTAADRERAKKRKLEFERAISVEMFVKHTDTKAPGYAEALKALEARAVYKTRDATGSDAQENALEKLLVAAHAAGCRDPLFMYFHNQFVKPSDYDLFMSTDRLKALAEPLPKAGYPAPRLMLLHWNLMVNHEKLAKDYDKDFKAEIDRHRDTFWTELAGSLMNSHPHYERLVYDHVPLIITDAKERGLLKPTYDKLEKLMTEAKSSEWLKLMVEARFYDQWGWDARGTKFAGQTSEDQFKLFHERQERAMEAYTQAWKLKPQEPGPAAKMVQVCTALGLSPKVREEWFERAMTADPGDYAACSGMANGLLPKWGGAPGEFEEFLARCAAHDIDGSSIQFLPLRMLQQELGNNTYVLGQLTAPGTAGYKLVGEVHERFLKKNPDDEYVRGVWYCLHVIWGKDQEAAKIRAQLPKDYKMMFMQVSLEALPNHHKNVTAMMKQRLEQQEKQKPQP